MSSEPFDDRPESVLDRALDRLIARPEPTDQRPPGAGLGVRAPGLNTVRAAGFRRVHGLGESADDTPLMTDSTVHDVASATKVAVTTALMMRLVSAGEVSLDASLRRYLPSFAGGRKDEVSLRDLLLHRAGLWEWWPLYMVARNRDEAFAVLEALPLRYEPGVARRYSDLGFIALGRVVECVVGAPLSIAAQSLLFDPLGMSSTRYAEAAPILGDVAASSLGDIAEEQMIATVQPYPVPFWVCDFSGWRREVVCGEANNGNTFHAMGGVSGHAGVFSTVRDLLTFVFALANPDENETMWRPAVVDEFFREGPDPGQALGFRRQNVEVNSIATPVLWHPGYTGCAIGVLPEYRAGVALATNRLHVKRTPVPTVSLWCEALGAAAKTLALGREASRSATACVYPVV